MMSSAVRSNEIRLYFSSVALLNGVRQNGDTRTKRDARNDLEGMFIHSENAPLRRKIAEILKKYQTAGVMQPAVEVGR